MKKNILAALVCAALVTAGCGGSSGNTTGTTTGTGTTGGTATTGSTGGTTGGTTTAGTTTTAGNTTSGGTTSGDTTRPDSGTVKTSSIRGSSVVSTGQTGDAGPGPVVNNSSQPNNYPRLAVGNFWWVNNAFNFNNTKYTGWSQTISLPGADGSLAPTVDYDWGGENDLVNPFATASFPELIFGAKSEFERSGSFADTGLPIANSDLPVQINIDYDYTYTPRATASPTGDANLIDSGYNIAIESFWHESCDIQRNETTGNQVFELMVWLHIGKRGPVAEGRNNSVGVFTDSNGRSYDVFSKTDAFFLGGAQANVRNYLAFVAQQEFNSGSLPYHEFINEARNNTAQYGAGWRNLKDTDCLANILLGTEVWYGAANFRWNDVTIEQVY